MARPRRKKSDGGGGSSFPIVGFFLLIVAVVYLFPVIAGFILYKKFKRMPPHSAYRRRCFTLMVFSIAILFFASTVSLINMFAGTDFDFGKIFQNILTIKTWLPLGIGTIVSLPLIMLFFSAFKAFERGSLAQQEGLEHYKTELQRAVADHDVRDERIHNLQAIVNEYGIPVDILTETHHAVFLDALYEASEDLKIDRTELSLLNHLSKALSVDDGQIDYANEFITKVNKVRAIFEGTVEGIEPPSYYLPKRGEVCYFCEQCELYENVAQTAYVGASFGLGDILPRKLLLNPRIYGGKRVSYNSMKKIDVGALVITNRRLAFIGDSVSRDFTFAKIIGINIGYDGIQINRSSKVKKEVFRLNALDKDLAAALIMNLTKHS